MDTSVTVIYEQQLHCHVDLVDHQNHIVEMIVEAVVVVVAMDAMMIDVVAAVDVMMIDAVVETVVAVPVQDHLQENVIIQILEAAVVHLLMETAVVVIIVLHQLPMMSVNKKMLEFLGF
jgi:hypothetical protein